MTPDTHRLLDEAARHLAAAAAIARSVGTGRGHHLAGLIDLTAAGLAPAHATTADVAPADGSLADRLRAALAVLDSVDPLDGPPDLLAWSAGVADLLRLATGDEATRP